MTRFLLLFAFIAPLGCVGADDESKSTDSAARTSPSNDTPTTTAPTSTTSTTSSSDTDTGTETTTLTDTGSTTDTQTTTDTDTETTSAPESLQLCINEFMPDNATVLTLVDDTPDWIELHNPGPDPVDLLGWSMSDDAEEPEKHIFETSLLIEPGAFFLLFADGQPDLGPAHLSFRLADEGEDIVLRDRWGHTSVIHFGAFTSDVSGARATDCCEGACWNYPYAGTPGESNVLPEPPERIEEVIIERGSVWRWFAGPDEPADWNLPGLDDDTWESGPGPLGYGDEHIVTTLPYGPDPYAKWITTYFRFTFEIDDASLWEDLSFELLCDDGAVVHLNGEELFRSNLPDGEIDYTTPALGAVGGADETRYSPLGATSDGLVDGTNVIAVELHQANGSSSDVGFDASLTLTGWVPAE